MTEERKQEIRKLVVEYIACYAEAQLNGTSMPALAVYTDELAYADSVVDDLIWQMKTEAN